jgi:hypothetical protein
MEDREHRRVQSGQVRAIGFDRLLEVGVIHAPGEQHEVDGPRVVRGQMPDAVLDGGKGRRDVAVEPGGRALVVAGPEVQPLEAVAEEGRVCVEKRGIVAGPEGMRVRFVGPWGGEVDLRDRPDLCTGSRLAAERLFASPRQYLELVTSDAGKSGGGEIRIGVFSQQPLTPHAGVTGYRYTEQHLSSVPSAAPMRAQPFGWR